jgi:translation initiation factor IF-1
MEGMEHIRRMEGIVQHLLPEGRVMVLLENGHCIDAEISAKIKVRFTQVAAGRRVRLELSPIEPGRARVVDCI